MLKNNNEYAVIKNVMDKLLGSDKKQIIIAIDGMSASGKTTLGTALAAEYDANLFHMDNFFLTPELRTSKRLSEVGGNVYYERFKKEVIIPIKSDECFTYSIYDCKNGESHISELIIPKRINIIEGSYSMHPYFGDIYDLKILLCIDSNTQQARILDRNGEFMLDMFINKWIPMENNYIKQTKLETTCDIIVKL